MFSRNKQPTKPRDLIQSRTPSYLVELWRASSFKVQADNPVQAVQKVVRGNWSQEVTDKEQIDDIRVTDVRNSELVFTDSPVGEFKDWLTEQVELGTAPGYVPENEVKGHYIEAFSFVLDKLHEFLAQEPKWKETDQGE